MPSSRARKLIAACLVIVVLTGAVLAGWRLFVHAYEGYFSPVFSPDRRAIYYFERRTRGIVWGLGFEHFTPPAHAHVLDDRIALKRLHRESGQIDTLIRWDSTPLVGRHLRTYRSRIFSVLSARLQFRDDGRLHYGLGLSIPVQPRSKSWWILGASTPDALAGQAPAPWHPGRRPLTGHPRFVLDEDWELVHIQGAAAYPPAIVLYRAAGGDTRIVRRSPSFRAQFPDGIPARMLEQRARRDAVERLDGIRQTRERVLAGFKAQGLSDGDARLRTSKALQEMGFYGKPAMLTARPAAKPETGVPVFRISEQEFHAGLFKDLAEALASPGTTVEHSTGTYLRYRDFDTSERLKAFLDDGGTRFYLSTNGGTYEIRISPPQPATR